MNKTGHILLVEDQEDDVFLMRNAFKKAGIENPLQVAWNGQEAMEYLGGMGKYSDRAKHPLPILVLLDLKMPYKSGFEILGWIREQPKLESLVIVVMTSSDQPQDIEKAYKLRASSYLVKPATASRLADMVKALHLYWLGHNQSVPLQKADPQILEQV
jgi:CheY-like chemotaxis protein